MPAPALTFKCNCIKCSRHPNGYEYQTKNLIRKHLLQYGRAMPPDRQEATPGPAHVQAQEDSEQQSHNVHVNVTAIQGIDHDQQQLVDQEATLGATGDNDDDFYLDEGEAGHGSDAFDEYQPQEPEPHIALRIQGPLPGVARPPDRVWTIVLPPDVQTPGSDADDADRPAVVPPAFKERPSVRLAYLHAAIGNVYHHLSSHPHCSSLRLQTSGSRP
ncbi:hypothetical protein C0992_004373 [Termitomyces sp. T32_za158]|nr:hypothetical protein C0992_004373 [Termitomyces sp. T32_za158]